MVTDRDGYCYYITFTEDTGGREVVGDGLVVPPPPPPPPSQQEVVRY